MPTVSTLLFLSGAALISSVLSQHATPTPGDMSAHNYINRIRTSPADILPELNYILCTEFHPVPSPGIIYDAAYLVCRLLVWPLTGGGEKAETLCDSSVRALLLMGKAPEPKCKVANMDANGIYKRRDGVLIQTSEGRAVVLEAIEFIKAQKPVPALRWNPDMWRACRDHAEE
jgi:hypothetical protein